MDNTNDTRIGCFLGNKEGSNNGSRTKIIDPNEFYESGNSSRNIPVRLEDLTISIKLTTTKRGRTTIFNDVSNTKDDGSNNVVKEQKGATINFFEGSDINGKKVLTTKFTELTTSFDSEVLNSETFGITNIDIDFNSSYTPMVKIDFIDVRGSSIFQNEKQLLTENVENKYFTFFELPYPLFELEIKGYYGQPVTYCLHMLKFNSKFNSQTGNFEISCEFIGYTYAMLSDMLIGILKAIPFTKIGGEKFNKYNENKNPQILNLVELKNKIALIPESIKKAALDTEEAKNINVFKPALEILNNLEAAVNNFGVEFTSSKILSNNSKTITVYDFVVLDNTSFSTPQQEKFNTLDKTVKDLITQYNELNISGAKINESDFSTPIVLNNLTKQLLQPDSTLTVSEDPKLKDKAQLELFKQEFLTFINNNYSEMASDYVFRAMDLRSRFKILKDQKELIEKSLNDTNKSLANKIKETVVVTLGFNPTVRNMIEAITALIEVFMETVYEVSNKAETSEVRKELFKEVFLDTKISDYNDTNFYPWPSYSEKEGQSNNYTEKYLGTNSVLKNRISDVPELEFIDDLLQGFLKASRLEASLDLLNAGLETLFFPVNPLDTKMFNEKAGNPYAIKELTNVEQIKRLMLIRGFTFLSYTNNPDYLTKGDTGEVRKMAIIEANTMLSAIINPTLKVSLKNLKVSDLVSTFGKINDADTKLIKYDEANKKYLYNYYFEDSKSKTKVLPTNSDLDGLTITTLGDPFVTNTLQNLSDQGVLFLTNYSSGVDYSKNVNTPIKRDDYGIYVKMFTDTEYSTDSTLVDTSVDTNSVINLKSLSENDISNGGFNIFGGIFGIQDFGKIDFGDLGTENTPARYVFYIDDNKNKNGLAYSRSKSASIKKNKENNKSIFDGVWTSNTKIPLPNSYSEFLRTKKNGNLIHENVGANRIISEDINTTPNNVSYPYIEQLTNIVRSVKPGDLPTGFSLFGSKWYYLQKNAKCTGSTGTITNAENYVKALLFLNTLPFNISYEDYDPFGKPEIKHLFDVKGGFVHAPRFWVAYVGAVLWWLSNEDPFVIDGKIVGGGRGIGDPVTWKKTCGNTSFFNAPANGYYFPRIIDKNIKIENDSVIRALPEQVKDEFKKVFFDFVNGTSDYVSWDTLRSGLEITNKTPSEFCGFLDRMRYKTTKLTPNNQPGLLGYDGRNDSYHFLSSQITTNLINYENYNIITTLPEGSSVLDINKHNFFLELNGASKVGEQLIKAFNEEIIIANTGYGIWLGKERNNPKITDINSGEDLELLRRPIQVSEELFNEYYETYISVINDSVSGLTLTNQAENELQELFGSKNKDDIKLMLYKHCKNIYDKWLGGITDSGNIIFQCGGDKSRSNRATTDKAVAEKYGNTSPRLIDSFRFVTRSFKDIGNELFIDPTPIANTIGDNPNSTAISLISMLLSDNKFEFIALPTFINYKDDDMLKSVFTPMQYSEAITSCGPTFVCVYTGQKSNKLDIFKSKYPNDGFDLRCNNGSPDASIPSDFSEPLNDYEDPVSVFVVNYSQQNQNIFKDISLDQSEFTETEESLKIVQDISTKGFENNPSIGGQNMYNVYAVRSYTAEVEMLGNAMIQPMMYFQLNNIPMFHGAYMIIRTRHNIRPNHMTTTFTGTRIKAIESPIIDVADAYMSLIETLELQDAGRAGNASTSGSFPPIVRTIIENGGTNGNVEVGNIKLVQFTAPKGVLNNVPKERSKMISEATASLTEMLKAFVEFAEDEGYPDKGGNYIGVTSLYRSYEYQQQLYNESKGDGSVARPGTSNHSWGIAVDLLFLPQKDGVYFKKNEWSPISTSANNEGFSLEYNPSLKWFLDNGYKYGFIIPTTLRDKSGTDEYWHFEYHGTSAKCLYNKQPSTYGYTPRLDSNYKPIVKNPKGTDNKEAVYLENECDFKYINVGDGASSDAKTIIGSSADYWSLVAICAAENFEQNPQGMADVAQSIYNRLNTPNKPYGKSIKEIIIEPNQYEPTFKNVSDWKRINDKATAILALKNSKKISSRQAEKMINISSNAITNKEYRKNSLLFIGTRTEFLADNPKSSEARGVVQRTPTNRNNAFFWRYAGVALINSQPQEGPQWV